MHPWSPLTFGDGSLEQVLPLLEAGGVAAQQQSGARGQVLPGRTTHRGHHVSKQLQLLTQDLADLGVLSTQAVCQEKTEIQSGHGKESHTMDILHKHLSHTQLKESLPSKDIFLS